MVSQSVDTRQTSSPDRAGLPAFLRRSFGNFSFRSRVPPSAALGASGNGPSVVGHLHQQPSVCRLVRCMMITLLAAICRHRFRRRSSGRHRWRQGRRRWLPDLRRQRHLWCCCSFRQRRQPALLPHLGSCFPRQVAVQRPSSSWLFSTSSSTSTPTWVVSGNSPTARAPWICCRASLRPPLSSWFTPSVRFLLRRNAPGHLWHLQLHVGVQGRTQHPDAPLPHAGRRRCFRQPVLRHARLPGDLLPGAWYREQVQNYNYKFGRKETYNIVAPTVTSVA